MRRAPPEYRWRIAADKVTKRPRKSTTRDGAGTVVAGPLLFSTRPHDGVVYRDATGYHGDLSAAGVSAGSYLLRVRFDSPTLIGDLLLGVDLS